jgi:hypothetical protein
MSDKVLAATGTVASLYSQAIPRATHGEHCGCCPSQRVFLALHTLQDSATLRRLLNGCGPKTWLSGAIPRRKTVLCFVLHAFSNLPREAKHASDRSKNDVGEPAEGQDFRTLSRRLGPHQPVVSVGNSSSQRMPGLHCRATEDATPGPFRGIGSFREPL